MKNWKSKVLCGLLFLLLAACAPQPAALNTSTGSFHSQCKPKAGKQTPDNFAYSRYVLSDTAYFPEALASLSEGSLKTDSYLDAFPIKNLPAKHLYNAGHSEVNKPSAPAQTIFSLPALDKFADTVRLATKNSPHVVNNPYIDKETGEKTVSAKIGLTLLAAYFFIALTGSLILLDYFFSVAGLETLGFLVFVAGEIVTIVLTVALLRKIFRKKKSVGTKEN